MTQIKSGYITGTNSQLQALRPFLVAEGFVDDKEWNDRRTNKSDEFIILYSRCNFFVHPHGGSYNNRELYTLSPDEDLEKAAKIIKEKFYE